MNFNSICEARALRAVMIAAGATWARQGRDRGATGDAGALANSARQGRDRRVSFNPVDVLRLQSYLVSYADTMPKKAHLSPDPGMRIIAPGPHFSHKSNPSPSPFSRILSISAEQ